MSQDNLHCKLWLMSETGLRTHESQNFEATERYRLCPVWGYRGKDTLSSEEKLGPRDQHAAKSPR